MIDGKVFAINRARAEARHAAQTSRLSQENSTLRTESAETHRLRKENAAMRALLHEIVTGENIPLPRSWCDRARALLGIRIKKNKRTEKEK